MTTRAKMTRSEVAKKARAAQLGGGHKPTPQTRELVKTMVAYGVQQERIAASLGINGDTFRKKYRKVIDQAIVSAHAQVGQSLFQMAVGVTELRDESGKVTREGVPRNVTAAIFYAKSHMGWREAPQIIEHSGRTDTKDAPAVPLNLSGLSTPQLEQLLTRIAVALETATD